MDELLNKIISKLERLLQTKSVIHTPIEGLTLYRKACTDKLLIGPDEILISLIFSGKKALYVGDERYEYAKGQFLFCGVNAPTLFHSVDESSKETLFMATLKLNQEILASTILTLDLKPSKESTNAQNKEILVFKAQESLVESFLRLINLLDDKSQMALIAPLVLEEIHIRLLFSECGANLCAKAMQGRAQSAIMLAIAYMRQNFKQNLSVSFLASKAHMSVSSFHRRFKEVTGLSPLQFHKQIRLHQAKLMLTLQQHTVAEIAYEIGYESQSQFIRDYRRHFGKTPGQELKELLLKT